MAWITNMPAFPITGTSLKKLANTAGKYILDVYKEYQKIDRLEKTNPRCSQMATGRSNYPNQIYAAVIGL